MKGMIRGAAVAAAAALALSACAEGGDSAGAGADGTYSMGVAMVLSGAQGQLGKDFVDYLVFGAEDASKKYGIELEVKSEDAIGTAEGGVNALNKLTAGGDTPVIMTAWSSVVKAMAPAAVDTGTAVINVAANSPELEGASGNLANLFPLATVDISALAEHVAEKEGKKSAGIIYIDNVTGQGAAEIYRKAFEDAGGKVVASESIKPDAIDASAQVAKVLAAKPDTVHVHVLGEAPVVFKGLKEQNFDGLATTYTSAGEDITQRKAAGAAMDGVVYSTLSSGEPSEAVESIRRRYVDKHGSEPSGLSYAGYVYDSAFLYAEVIKRLDAAGKDVTGDNIIAEFRAGKAFALPVNGEVTFSDRLTTSLPVTIRRIGKASDLPSEDEAAAVVN